jgi:DNA ligase-4
MFHSLTIYLDKAPLDESDQMLQQCSPEPALDFASSTVRFGSGKVTDDLNNASITHIVIGKDRSRLQSIRETISVLVNCSATFCGSPPLIFDRRTCLPRIVTFDWVDQSWNEKTLLDEESKWLLLSQDVFLTGIP